MQERAYLREHIEQEIAQEPRVSGKVTVEVAKRHIRLSGVVNSLEQKELAESIARKYGPVDVENDIVIESTKAIEDEEVLSEARRAIAKNPDLAHDIGIDRVVDGVAYLKGHSESVFEIEQAAETVAEAPGVKDVVSEIKITPGVSITDVDLVGEVKQALHAEPSIHSEFISASAKNGVVTLSGTVDNMDQKALASNIAKLMPGVAKVVNILEVNESPTSIDKAIENEVIKALEISDINMANVRVNVLDGVAYLDGSVNTIRQKELARRIAESVQGVRYVQNDLVIGFHIEPKAG